MILIIKMVKIFFVHEKKMEFAINVDLWVFEGAEHDGGIHASRISANSRVSRLPAKQGYLKGSTWETVR